jgi:hypothetical protein
VTVDYQTGEASAAADMIRHSLTPWLVERRELLHSGRNRRPRSRSATPPTRRAVSLHFKPGSPLPLRLLAIETGRHAREAELHERFAADRMHGEWFRPSASLLSYIAEVAS